MRYVILDTETTGLNHETGDRVFEVGCVEIVDKTLTSRTFHRYVNPEKEISLEVQEICKIDPSILVGKPLFSEIASDLLKFLHFNNLGEGQKGILIAHNARFDIDFLNMELTRSGMDDLSCFEVFDTVKMAKIRNPKVAANLDNLCKMMEIDLSVRQRDGHGALTDSKLLAEVFLNFIKDEPDDYVYTFNKVVESFFGITKRDIVLPSRDYKVSDKESSLHEEFLKLIGSEYIW